MVRKRYNQGVADGHSSITLPADATAAGLARRHLAAQHGEILVLAGGTALDNALLLISELVANAVAHGTGSVYVAIHLDGTRLRLEVHDQSPDLPKQRVATLDDDNGRGLLIVDTLAAAWGTRATPVGKAVWCDMAVG
jgi:anti-sigma regulatory factor (Ser/Thr protein kinase)